MHCPACKNVDLVMLERQGIEIDRCPRCRGVWLDRGKRDEITNRSIGSQATAPAERVPQSHPRQPAPGPAHPDPQQGHCRRKRRGLLSELFGFHRASMRPAYPILATLALLAACAAPHPPLPTVEAVDLQRYAGTWYEIARLPNRFQSMCASDTQAVYRPDGERVSVLNSCRTTDGKREQADGIARVVEGSQGAKLRVSFFRPFYGDYWVLELDPDYRWVLVGEPSRRYAWVLAREPALDRTTLDALLTKAAALGFERQAFLTTPHTASGR